MSGKRVVITGITGFIGSKLAERLRQDGWEVVGVSRKPPRPGTRDLQWDPYAGKIDAAGLEGAEAVVHLAGESVADGAWTPERKEAIRKSRVAGTELLARTLAGLSQPPPHFLSASAIGFYGSRGDEVLTEASAPGTGFLVDVCREWEAATAPAEKAGLRVAHMRIGIVLGPEGGALEKMLPPFKAGLGSVFGSGNQWMSWIALPDIVEQMRFLLGQPELAGPFNLVGPNPATNRDFTRALNRVLGRPGFLPVPSFAVKMLFGEMGEATLLGSQRVLPQRLLDAGFRFQYPDLEGALRTVLGK